MLYFNLFHHPEPPLKVTEARIKYVCYENDLSFRKRKSYRLM